MTAGRTLRIRHVCRSVGDLSRAVAFYQDALHFVLVQEQRHTDPASSARIARLRLGEEELKLVAFGVHGLPYPSRRSACDPWFQHLAIVVADMPAAYAQLCRYAFEPITHGGPQRLSPNTGGVAAFKFRDPDGHPLELIHFPAGVGDPRWQHREGLFLGIDHTAIVVSEVQKSLDFYASLGFRVTSRSHNIGPEQDRLDGLTGADVDVIGLAPAEEGPPRLELLGYRRPADNAGGIASDDIAVDQTVLEVEHLAAILKTPRLHHQGWENVALVQDPDGHRLLLHAGN